jgi:protein SCO1
MNAAFGPGRREAALSSRASSEGSGGAVGTRMWRERLTRSLEWPASRLRVMKRVLSRGAAKECSPGREPGVADTIGKLRRAPEGRKNVLENASNVLSPLRGSVRDLAFLLALTLAAPVFAQTSATPPVTPGRVAIDQRLDQQVPLDLQFRSESGKIVHLRDYFRGKPVILNLVYYRCPMLCSIVTDGLTNSLSELKFDIGNEFDVLTVSFDPRDTPLEATARRTKFVKRYGRPGAGDGWHFLTGSEPSIRALTDSVGFYYAYDSKIDQYAHGATLIILTPAGRISRYFYGFEYKPRDIRLGLVEASAGRIGSMTDAILLMCYHYDPATGRYSRMAMNYVRAGGVATMLSLGGFIFIMIRRERRVGR